MKIQDLLNKKVMLLDLQATTKEAAIDEMINSLVDNGVVTDFDVFKAGIMAREAQTSTGLGDGIASRAIIPDLKTSKSVTTPLSTKLLIISSIAASFVVA